MGKYLGTEWLVYKCICCICSLFMRLSRDVLQFCICASHRWKPQFHHIACSTWPFILNLAFLIGIQLNIIMIFIHPFGWSYQAYFKCPYSLVKLLWLNIYPNFLFLSFYWVVCFLLLSFSVLSVFWHVSIITRVSVPL